METTHIIKLSTGKTIKLTDQEYQELRRECRTIEYQPSPSVYPPYPWTPPPFEPWVKAYTSDNTEQHTQAATYMYASGINDE